MEHRKGFFKSPLFILGILILFHLVNNYIWLRLNQRPPIDDEAKHLINSLQYLDIISKPSFAMFSKLVKVDSLYPPFFPLIAAFLGLIFGKSTIVLIMTNVLFLSGIFLCLYFIGLKMRDKRLGVLASFLLSLYPMFFHLGRMFMLSIALCFMVTASITLLMYSEGFRKRIISILFGIFCGLGLLTKQSYIIFIIGPLFFLLSTSFLSGEQRIRLKITVNCLLFLLVVGVLLFLWYLPNIKAMLPLFLNAAFDTMLVPHDIPVFSLRSFLFYFELLINDQILFFFFLIFILSLFIIFRKKKERYFYIFFIWIILPYCILTLVKNKFWYYTVPYLPAIAFISSYGILNIDRNYLRRILIILISAIGFLQFFFISYTRYGHVSLHIGIHTETKELAAADIFLAPMKNILEGVTYYPQKGDWKINVITARIVNESYSTPAIGFYRFDANLEARKNPQKEVIISKLDSYVGANFEALRYSLELKGIPYRTTLLGYAQDKTLGEIDFIISPFDLKNIDDSGFKIDDYMLLESFVMPDKSEVYLYKLNKDSG